MRRRDLFGAIALMLAVVAGASAGLLAAPDRETAPAATRNVRVGVATLVIPSAWRTAPPAGARGEPTAVFAPSPRSAERTIVTVGRADDRSLVPGVLRDLVAEPPRDPVRGWIAGHDAWRYPGLPGRNRNRTVDLTVLPTTRGVLGVACVSESASRANADCASSIASASFGPAAVLVPGTELAFRLRLPGVMAALDLRRVRERQALRRARGPAARGRLARRLAHDHRAAARTLRPLAGRSGDQLVRRLSAAAVAYDALAGAAGGRSAARFDAARRDVDAADGAVAAAVDRVAGGRPPEALLARPPAIAARSGGGRTGMVLAVLALPALALAALWFRRRRASSPSPRPVTAAGPSPRRSRAAQPSSVQTDAARWDTPPPGVGGGPEPHDALRHERRAATG